MGYFNYHAVVKNMIRQGKLVGYYYTGAYRGISPALVLLFADEKRPACPIRLEKWEEYRPLLPAGLQMREKAHGP